MLLTAEDAASQVGRNRSTLRNWTSSGLLTPAARGPRGALLFDLAAVFEAEREARLRRQHALRHGRAARRVARLPLDREVRTGRRSWSAEPGGQDA